MSARTTVTVRPDHQEDPMSSSMADYNQQVIEQFRAGGGKIDGLEAMPLLLLHHTGARSGTARVNPLAYLRDGERYAIFGSKAGAPTNPDWYHNVKANPEVEIEVGSDRLRATASEATGAERDRLFDAQAGAVPQFAEYAEQTDRVIPVIVLTPDPGDQ
jgi:deazaflavin-dependent oxidoreductase (nitroreductase family)